MNKLMSALLGACVLAGPAAQAADGGDAGLRLQPGLTFASGLSDLREKIEQNNPFVDLKQISVVGLSFAGYYQFGGGMAMGAMVGPVAAATGDVDFVIVPLALDLRYRFASADTMQAYARLGVERALVSGDLISSGSAGAVLGLGVEFTQPGGRGFGMELAAHSTEIIVDRSASHAEQKAKPYKATLSLFYVF